MNYAIIIDGIVENIAVSNRQMEANWIQIPADLQIAIGDTWDGVMFFDPDGNPRLTPETEAAQKRIIELEEENLLKTAQIQALSDRNDFLEDCIAEMAGMVYA